LGRTARLSWVELTKLATQKLFLFILLMTLVLTYGLGHAGKYFSKDATTGSFSNYSLWVLSSRYALTVATILLVALGAMAMSSEATARTLNTMLTRPVRRIEFAVAKAISLLVATLAVVGSAAFYGYMVGGSVPDRPQQLRVLMNPEADSAAEKISSQFVSYGDVVDPDFPDAVIATKEEAMGDILFCFLLMVVPILAGVSVGFLIGTLLDSSGLAIAVTVGLFASLEVTKLIPLADERLGRYLYNYPITKLASLMLDAGDGKPPIWDDVLAAVQVSAVYVVVCFLISFVVFCRRDVTL